MSINLNTSHYRAFIVKLEHTRLTRKIWNTVEQSIKENFCHCRYRSKFHDILSHREFITLYVKLSGKNIKCFNHCLVWGLRLWREQRAPVWELSWYWLELSALKAAILVTNANIKFLDEFFSNKYHTYANIKFCNQIPWRSPWAERSISLRGQFHQNTRTCLDLSLSNLQNKRQANIF